MGQADDVAVGRLAEDERVHGQEGVEPAPRLVDGLADEVGREAALEQPVAGEGMVELGGRHRAGVEPGVEDGFEPRRRGPAVIRPSGYRAGEGHLVDVGTVQVESSQVPPGELGELGHRPHAGVVLLPP